MTLLHSHLLTLSPFLLSLTARRSVVACRLIPVQKQQLVALVKNDSVPKTTTLAIGDGANDVSMIREADVGVGIIGKEGRQAANNADFAIGQFKFLRRLMLIHGRWNYIRQSKAFLYCMHKNLVVTFTLFWFNFYNALSGQTPYESWIFTCYNLALGLPIVLYGIMDRDVPANYALKFPRVYSTGKTNSQMDLKAISTWVFNAILIGMFHCLMFYLALRDTWIDYDVYAMGTCVLLSLIFGLQVKVAFLHNQWNFLHVLSMFVSLLGTMIWVCIVSSDAYSFNEFYYTGFFVFDQAIFWFFCLFFGPIFLILVDLIGHAYHLFLRSTQEMEYREDALKKHYGKQWCQKKDEINERSFSVRVG